MCQVFSFLHPSPHPPPFRFIKLIFKIIISLFLSIYFCFLLCLVYYMSDVKLTLPSPILLWALTLDYFFSSVIIIFSIFSSPTCEKKIQYTHRVLAFELAFYYFDFAQMSDFLFPKKNKKKGNNSTRLITVVCSPKMVIGRGGEMASGFFLLLVSISAKLSLMMTLWIWCCDD